MLFIVQQFEELSFNHVRRIYNREADDLSKKAIIRQSGFLHVEEHREGYNSPRVFYRMKNIEKRMIPFLGTDFPFWFEDGKIIHDAHDGRSYDVVVDLLF